MQDLLIFNNNVKVLSLKKDIKKYLKGLQVVMDQYVWDEVHKDYKTDSLYTLEENGQQLMFYEVILDSYVLPPEKIEEKQTPLQVTQVSKDDIQEEEKNVYSFNYFDIKAKCKFASVTALDLLTAE